MGGGGAPASRIQVATTPLPPSDPAMDSQVLLDFANIFARLFGGCNGLPQWEVEEEELYRVAACPLANP